MSCVSNDSNPHGGEYKKKRFSNDVDLFGFFFLSVKSVFFDFHLRICVCCVRILYKENSSVIDGKFRIWQHPILALGQLKSHVGKRSINMKGDVDK